MRAPPIALITGAASGLGLELAKALQCSHQLVLVDVNEQGLAACRERFPNAYCEHVDLADSHAIEQLLDKLLTQLPRLDLLINNAGITHRSPAASTSIQVMEKVMAVDYFAAVQLSQGLLPLLTASAGKIVNIGSMAGWMPVIERAGYCAAKSALHQYFETLRAELNRPGAVLMVYPSFLDTPIEHHALDSQGAIASHPRTTAGAMRSSDWMAKRIVKAMNGHQERLFPDRLTYFASVLYRLAPRLYLRLMRRKLGGQRG
ncbi:Putative oxidoreductase SadH [Pseudidiomarina piscicola]|uniref:Oxidoreductase SadH n=1 Tax=Pseudidiomarina piscicola TaxID=2614830 RepID=A0A6S6WTR8_9GAMM|nr:SDR family NAD(P)-dependent oxidoreductase [Pseudidiomarina piscicola]CAB0150150.1 Putative oxidoreductase SadH [Pseudidiomarina piscicola]VZT39589.1 Putative oxidoreductase SadH [Pseudomonas aeruginosa]